MGPVELLLRRAGELITPDENRCVGPMAMDEDGRSLFPEGEFASRWCAYGALKRAAWLLGVDLATRRRALAYLDEAASRLGFTGFVIANETTNTMATPDVYSEAIESASEFGV